MGPTPDRILQGRLFSYPDTHRHRLGANFDHIPVNCPYRAQVWNTIRDAPMNTTTNQGSSPNYEPNSRNLTHNTFTFNTEARYSPYKVTGLVARVKPDHPNDDFSQPGTLFRRVFDDQMRKNTVATLVGAIKGVRQDIAERVVKMFYMADSELGNNLGKGLGFPAISSRL